MIPIGLLAILVGSVAPAFSREEKKAEAFSPYVDSTGKISLPTGFREQWAYLGTWVVPDPKDPATGVHDVFTQPDSVIAYKKDGRFPDGAVLVKEIRNVQADQMTTGKAHYAQKMVHWFVMIKDSKGRFPDNPNWGDGWGWALFKPDDPSKNTSTSYQNDCLPCHIPAKPDDWIYVRGYPTLR